MDFGAIYLYSSILRDQRFDAAKIPLKRRVEWTSQDSVSIAGVSLGLQLTTKTNGRNAMTYEKCKYKQELRIHERFEFEESGAETTSSSHARKSLLNSSACDSWSQWSESYSLIVAFVHCSDVVWTPTEASATWSCLHAP